MTVTPVHFNYSTQNVRLYIYIVYIYISLISYIYIYIHIMYIWTSSTSCVFLTKKPTQGGCISKLVPPTLPRAPSSFTPIRGSSRSLEHKSTHFGTDLLSLSHAAYGFKKKNILEQILSIEFAQPHHPKTRTLHNLRFS